METFTYVVRDMKNDELYLYRSKFCDYERGDTVVIEGARLTICTRAYLDGDPVLNLDSMKRLHYIKGVDDMVFFFRVIIGLIAVCSVVAVACIFVIDKSDDELQDMESYYNQNYRKDD